MTVVSDHSFGAILTSLLLFVSCTAVILALQGKSAVVLALIAVNPMPPHKRPSKQQVLNYRSKKNKRLRVKTTVIMTSVSLLGQWEDECRRHAPGLKVARHHGNKKIQAKDLYDLDVIISTSTFNWDEDITGRFNFRRVVVDESHLFATAPSSAKVHVAMQKCSKFRWCVTATPCVSSAADLRKQLMFLNGNKGKMYHRYESIQRALARYTLLTKRSTEASKKQAFYGLLDELKKSMIRHTKSQRIHGSEALALPESTTTTVYLDMSAREQQLFGRVRTSSTMLRYMERIGAKALTVEQCFAFDMYNVKSDDVAGLTKIKTLIQDLRELRVTEPSFRVVVYTQSLVMHGFVVEALQQEGLTTLQFNGSTSATKRDKTIRQFQNQQSDPNPAVFVITLRSGNVGITLTAASRVYLMEPSMDPSAEVQAAGRIHRLGQTKAVQVKKLVFRNCFESNIVDLQKEIAAGRISISDKFFPPEAIQILAKNVRTTS